MRRLLLVMLVATGGWLAPSPASAVRSTIGFELDPARVFDSRQIVPALPRGEEVPISLTPGTIVNVMLDSVQQPGWLYFHPCGSPPDDSTPAAAYVPAGSQTVNMVPIRTGENCLTLVGDADLVIDQIGNEGEVGGSAYVAHPDAVALDVELVTTGVTRVAAVDASVAADAELIAVWVTVFARATQAGMIIPASCDTGEATGTQAVVATAGNLAANLVLVEPDANGDICFRADSLVPDEVAINRYGFLSPTATPTAEGLPYSGFVEDMLPGYTALTPGRVFDTRDGGTPVAGGSVFRHTFSGLPDDTTAIAINLTVTQTTAPGFVSAYPCEDEAPEVSNVNFTGPDQTIPNFGIVAIGPSHELCFYASATTHLLADLSGYFAWGLGDGYVPRVPDRLFDTRTGGAPIGAGTTYVADLGDGATMSAAVLNVTVTQPDRPGFVTVYPCDAGAPPTASNLNFGAGQTRPNMVTVRVPSDGQVCFYSSARVHLIADISGGYSNDSVIGFAEFTPSRIFDTREPPNDEPIFGNEEYFYDLGDTEIEAVAWNVTATAPAGPGFVSLYPCGDVSPDTSNVNFTDAGQTVANFAIVTPSDDGEICLFTPTTTHLIADEAGVFYGPVPFEIYYEGDPP